MSAYDFTDTLAVQILTYKKNITKPLRSLLKDVASAPPQSVE